MTTVYCYHIHSAYALQGHILHKGELTTKVADLSIPPERDLEHCAQARLLPALQRIYTYNVGSYLCPLSLHCESDLSPQHFIFKLGNWPQNKGSHIAWESRYITGPQSCLRAGKPAADPNQSHTVAWESQSLTRPYC